MKKIDAMVAERVMGWKWWSSCGKSHLCPPWAEHSAGFMPGRHFMPGKEFDAAPIEDYYSNYGNMAIPKYSTDPAAMMVVVEKMCELGWQYEFASGWVTRDNKPTHNACFWKTAEDGREVSWDASGTMPLAVCLAALRAVGVPEAEIQAAMGERSEA